MMPKRFFVANAGRSCVPNLQDGVVPGPPSSAPTPLHWLLSRQRGLKPLLWVAVAIGCANIAMLQMMGRLFGMGIRTFSLGAFPVIGLAEATIEGGLFAWVASRFLIEARRTGELELLLTTPLGAEELVSTQWETLKSFARWPVMVLVGLPLILNGFGTALGRAAIGFLETLFVLSLLLRAANTVLGVGVLFWLAPWLALQVTGQGRVIFWAVLLVRGLPYVVGSGWSLVYQVLIRWVGAVGNLWSGSLWFLGFLCRR